MKRSWIAVLAVAALVSLTGVGCGHYHHDGHYVTVESGTYEPFTLTLVNHTNQDLLPGPITAEPYEPNVPAVVIHPGDSATYSIGFLPSQVTVGAVGVGLFSSYTYPDTTIYLGIDYYSDSAGATFIYH
jgi:hypothetical protein